MFYRKKQFRDNGNSLTEQVKHKLVRFSLDKKYIFLQFRIPVMNRKN